jgi:hypothetical protein
MPGCGHRDGATALQRPKTVARGARTKIKWRCREHLHKLHFAVDPTKNTNFSQKNTGSSQNLKDQVVDAGAEMEQRAGDTLRASTDIARDKFKEATDAAKDVASGTADQVQGQASALDAG